jgi:Uma2 family endonuclease
MREGVAMSTTGEIILPETKPATEWILGRAVQKVSPRQTHAAIQALLAGALSRWAMEAGLGTVGTEWEFRVTPPGEITRPLVPDIAFLSFSRLGYDEQEAQQIPYIAPDVAFEIISPGDQRSHLLEKIRVYLAAGARAVVILDPKHKSLMVNDDHGERKYNAVDTFEHSALPGFAIHVDTIFVKPKPKK